MSKSKISKEDKELLLKDLCARIPYHAKVEYRDSKTVDLTDYIRSVSLPECRPWLRPLSDITEDEKSFLRSRYGIVDIDEDVIDFGEFPSKNTPMSFKKLMTLYDWLNSHHFDYRGLIKKGLALEASKEMYEI